MKRTFLSAIAALSMIWGAWTLEAKHSDAFLLGVYSSLNNGSEEDRVIRDSLAGLISELGYNATTIRTRSDDTDLAGLLQMMDKKGIDAIVNDFSWNASKAHEHRFAVQPVSISNYLRFEAEFSGPQDVKPGDALDSQYWYASAKESGMPRVGQAVESPGASYGWVWQASEGQDRAGLIYTDIRYRWPNRNGAFVRFGAEFMIHQNDPRRYPDDHIWVTYRFRLDNLDRAAGQNEPLLKFYLAGYEFSGSGFSRQEKVLKHNGKTMGLPETVFTLRDYLQARNDDGWADLTISVSYADLIAAGLLTSDHDFNPATADSPSMLRLVNLNPRLYWYGKGDVILDHIEIEDQPHHELAEDPAFWGKGIIGRMKKVMSQSQGNIRAFYTYDEPYLGNFDTFKRVQEIAAAEGIEVFTATYDYQQKNFVLGNSQKYDHLEAYRKMANPRTIAPDIYPVYPGMVWNLSDRGKGEFIQDVLDEKMLTVYRECKEYRDSGKGRSLFPIVQVLGNWVKSGDREQWTNWIQPPLATQKSLLFLPLCYGPDGILHFSMRVVQTQEGYGYRGISYSRKGVGRHPHPQPDPITWTAVASTNTRVLEYGRLIRKLNWLGSETIGTKASGSRKLNKQNQLSSIKVKKARNGDYEGYVQCAYYQDAKGQPWFMLVNRRANFFTPGAITDPRYVPAEQFNDYFPEAAPQTLAMKFDRKVVKGYGGNFGLYDPVDKKTYAARKGVIEISIPAGEGRLLQLVRTKS